MNFQLIPNIETPKSLLDGAFRHARERAGQKKFQGEWAERSRRKECLKIDVVTEHLVSKLERYLQAFPAEKGLPDFYLKLMHLTIDYVLYKKSLASLKWLQRRIQGFQKEYARKVAKGNHPTKFRQATMEFYGRVSSIVKQVGSNLEYLGEVRKIMRTYPDIKDLYTVCIYGFPNVGKSTLLNKLAGSKAKVAAYAFTTTTINSGFIKTEDRAIQILDVPGTLARKDVMNPIELQAELVRTDLAGLVIYVFDLSESSGYSYEQQEELYRAIKDENVLVYVSKTDITDPEILKKFKHKYYTFEQLKEKIIQLSKNWAPLERAEVAVEEISEDQN